MVKTRHSAVRGPSFQALLHLSLVVQLVRNILARLPPRVVGIKGENLNEVLSVVLVPGKCSIHVSYNPVYFPAVVNNFIQYRNHF